MSWTDERIEQLRNLWQQGNTASQIAEALGGVSRNAVIGKAHRLGLQARPSPVKSAETAEKAAAAPPTPRAAPSKPPSAADAAAPPAASPTPPAAPTPRVIITPPQVSQAAPLPPTPRPVEPPQPMMRPQFGGGPTPPVDPAPPRRAIPAKPAPEMKDKTSLLDLNDKICKWPIGHPGEADFHFCGQPVNPGFPYCTSHCAVAYQAQLPRRDRRPPPLPYGGPRVR